jgi:4'-phosphopantetheinyl transferase
VVATHAPFPPPLVVAGPTNAVLARCVDAWELLSEVEQERARAFHFESDRADFVAAHALVRVCAAQLLGVPASSVTIVQRCAICGQPHGRPSVDGAPEVSVSLSHTAGYVAAAVGTVEVGVDVERVGRGGSSRVLLQQVLSAAEILAVEAATSPEIAFLRCWVRKEALTKIGVASLHGLRGLDLSALPVDLEAGGPGSAPTRGVPPGWSGSPGALWRHRWRHLHVLDWSAVRHQVVGAALSPAPARLMLREPGESPGPPDAPG